MGLGGDNNNSTGPPKETAENATENDTGDPSSTSDGLMSASGETLYALLNLNKGTSEDEINRAYRKQASRYHPDNNTDDPTAEVKFKEINYAHNVLTNEKKRQIYDEYGSFGLYIAKIVGDDCIGLYLRPNCKCFKITSLICFIATGCCCCCCCCCCFLGCCGRYSKCMPDSEGGSTDGGDTGEPVRNQPTASCRSNNEEIAML